MFAHGRLYATMSWTTDSNNLKISVDQTESIMHKRFCNYTDIIKKNMMYKLNEKICQLWIHKRKIEEKAKIIVYLNNVVFLRLLSVVVWGSSGFH